MPPRQKAELLEIVERVVTLYEKEHKKFTEIEEILQSEGINISKSSIHRAYQTYNAAAEKYKAIAEETKELLNVLKDNPTTDIMEGIHAIMSNHVFEYVRSIQSLDFKDAGELALAINKLAMSSEKLTKFRLDNLKKATEKLEVEGKKRQIDPEFIAMMKKEIYGIS